MHPLLIEIGKVCLAIFGSTAAVVFVLMLYAYAKNWGHGLSRDDDGVDNWYKRGK